MSSPEWHRLYKDRKAELGRIYYEANKERLRLMRAARYARDKTRVQAVNAAWRANNAERDKAYKSKWHKDHPEVRARNARAYSRRVRRNRPKCVPLSELTKVYDACPDGMVVDHIVPIKAKLDGIWVACGLHVPWNLQYLTNEENTRKGCDINYEVSNARVYVRRDDENRSCHQMADRQDRKEPNSSRAPL